MTRPTFYRIEAIDMTEEGNRLGVFCRADGIIDHYDMDCGKPMRSDRGDPVLQWLPPANAYAVEMGALCWFTPEGWRKFEETGDMTKVFHRLVHFGVRYRVRRIPTDKVRPLYSDGLQALLPRHI